MLQKTLSDCPAVVKTADKVGSFRARIVEEGFTKRRHTANELNRLGRYARRVHIEEDKADACMLWHVAIGAY